MGDFAKALKIGLITAIFVMILFAIFGVIGVSAYNNYIESVVPPEGLERTVAPASLNLSLVWKGTFIIGAITFVVTTLYSFIIIILTREEY